MTQQLNFHGLNIAISVLKFNPWSMVNQKYRYTIKGTLVVSVASGLNCKAAFEFTKIFGGILAKIAIHMIPNIFCRTDFRRIAGKYSIRSL